MGHSNTYHSQFQLAIIVQTKILDEFDLQELQKSNLNVTFTILVLLNNLLNSLSDHFQIMVATNVLTNLTSLISRTHLYQFESNQERQNMIF